jgi:CTP synthase (UTP-ammonia lyase)
MKASIAIISEAEASKPEHAIASKAIMHSADFLRAEVRTFFISPKNTGKWLFTEADGIFLAPSGPCKHLKSMFGIIRYARVNSFPCLGTYRGFQYMVLEFARNVLRISNAAHEEQDPNAENLVITRLQPSNKNRRRLINVVQGSPLEPIYRKHQSTENFYGHFGVNPEVERSLEAHDLVSMAFERDGNFRAAGIPDHPFFFGTLFLPQMRTTKDSPHPLITTFLKAAIAMKAVRKSRT